MAKALLAGPSKQGYATELWTPPRVGAFIGKVTGRKFHPTHVSRILHAIENTIRACRVQCELSL